jgi:hypothetical protein
LCQQDEQHPAEHGIARRKPLFERIETRPVVFQLFVVDSAALGN